MAKSFKEDFKQEQEIDIPENFFLDTDTEQETPKQSPKQQQTEAPAPAQTEAAIPTTFTFEHRKVEVKSKRLQLVLKPSLYEKVKAKAAEHGLSINDFCHQVLEQVTRA